MSRGFTLIELLVVVAIIGILASVVVVSLSGSRTPAKEAGALSALRSAQIIAVVCADDVANLDTPPAVPPSPRMCANREVWPYPLSDGWEYGDTSGKCVFDGDVGDHSFRFCAKNTAGTRYISCTNTGCVAGNS